MYSRYISTRAFSSAAAAKNRVGFMGLGNMGMFMARNLTKAGYSVQGFDISEKALKAAEGHGIKPCATMAKAAKDVDFIVSALPATAHVDAMLKSEDGVFANANEGTFICDTSTISPLASKEFAALAPKYNMVFLDTPMSGGVTGAENGTLTFMVGGENEHLEIVRPVLEGMGKNIFHCGGPGTGEIAKLSNNLILGISMIAASEGMALGEKLGIDPKVLQSILAVSTARNWCIDTYNPRPGVLEGVPASRNYENGFGVSLVKKDLALALEVAEKVNAKTEFTEKSLEYYRTLEKQGHGTKDFGIVFQHILKNEK